MPSARPAIVILGATASGKTALAMALAESLHGEIVSFDSACAYRGLDIGTAKPDAMARARVPHHVLDVCEPTERFSAGRFVEMAEEAIAAIRQHDAVPMLVGGTGLYLRCLLRGLTPSAPADAALRAGLDRREARRPGSLHRLLLRLDPATASRVDPRDVRRQVRALEHRIRTGHSLSAQQVEWTQPERLETAKLGLFVERAARERLIRQRVDAMLAAGLADEVRGLIAAGVPTDAPGFRALGYRDVIAHVEGRSTAAELRERLVLVTRQYAKRQDTWFRREEGVRWLEGPADEARLPGLLERAQESLLGR